MILRFMQAVNVMETVNLVLRSGNVENISSANLIFLALSGGWKGPFDFPFLFYSRPNFSGRTSAETLATQASPTRIWKTIAIVYSALRLANSPNLLATIVEFPTQVRFTTNTARLSPAPQGCEENARLPKQMPIDVWSNKHI